MKWPASILLLVLLFLQAGPAPAFADKACASEERESCGMACCEQASCACLEGGEDKHPVTPSAPAPERAVLPAFVWLVTEWQMAPGSRDLITSGFRRTGNETPRRETAVPLTVLYCAFLT